MRLIEWMGVPVEGSGTTRQRKKSQRMNQEPTWLEIELGACFLPLPSFQNQLISGGYRLALADAKLGRCGAHWKGLLLMAYTA